MPGTTNSERSSRQRSTTVPAPSPPWPAPRNPLPPHRLAKLANALGVSTPLPAIHAHAPSHPGSPIVPTSSASSSFDHFRRSPTPSATSAQTFTSHASSTKFLLHVVPPHHLPHDPDAFDDSDLNPPPPTASGYHPQFRRGVLVPVCPTLPSQLAAIAKEYALPSTAGIVLYLVSSRPASLTSDAPETEVATEEPGPRISEDVWRHIWNRVVKAERDESATPSPRPFGLGLTPASSSSPNLLQDIPPNTLRPVAPPSRAETPQPQSAVTQSSTAPSFAGFSQAELDPSDSVTSAPLGEDLPLPGLHSPALIPVLAKVEFDIDRRRAAWYEPWVRSRRINHAKRAESRQGARKRSQGAEEEEETQEREREAPLGLRLVKKVRPGSATPRFLREPQAEDDEDEYAQLPDSPDELDAEDADPTARLGQVNGDPLADVFGTDDETWADMHPDGRPRRASNPNVVDLALDGAALGALPVYPEERAAEAEDGDVEEVAALMEKMGRPPLIVSIPDSPTARRRSSPTTAGTIKKHPPPPLNLAVAQGDKSRLPYLAGSTPTTSTSASTEGEGAVDESMSQYSQDDEGGVPLSKKLQTPLEEKREGAFFDDLNLGLEGSMEGGSMEFDESDPHDRRRSQFIMKAQLDEIERNLAQFSPRQLRTEELQESSRKASISSATLSPSTAYARSPMLNVDSLGSPQQSSARLPAEGASWPAVPYSALQARDPDPSDADDLPPSPPKIAFNGVSTEPPRSPFMIKSRPGAMSDESLARQREQEALYPPLVPPPFNRSRSADSPVIPLSPDPFGRFPSGPFEAAQAHHLDPPTHELTPHPQSGPPVGARRPPSQTPSSRFSLDSVPSDDDKRAKATSLVSVKSFKKLWRKTNNKLSLSGATTPTPDSGRTSPNDQPSRPASRTYSRSPQPSEFLNANGEGMPMPQKQRRKPPSIHSLYFDGDSAYPTIPSRTPPLDASRGPSPQFPPIPTSARTFVDSRQSSPIPSQGSSPQIPGSAPPTDSKGSVRKSILKSWKSSSGSVSQVSLHSAGSRTSTDLLANMGPEVSMKKRRPSLLEGFNGRRGSTVSSSQTTLVDIPPSPAIPEHFAQAQAQSRASSRQSQLKEQRKSVQKQGSISSSSSASPPRPSRLNPSSPPRNGSVLRPPSRSSIASGDSRHSFDTSQFEIVSPKLGSHKLESTLSYPYHTLDHSMTSAE